MRRALLLAVDQWHGAPALAKIANVHMVGGIVFPGSPLATTKEELQQIAGFWPGHREITDGGEAPTEGGGGRGPDLRAPEPQRRPALQVCRHLAHREWSKIGLNATQRVVPTGPWFEAMRSGNFDVVLEANCEGVVNPLMDTQKYLPRSVYTENYGMYDDQLEIDLHQEKLRETDVTKQRALMRDFEKRVIGYRGA